MERRAAGWPTQVTGDETGKRQGLSADLPHVPWRRPKDIAVTRDLPQVMLNELTPREQSVIRSLLDGSTMGEIASDLGVSEAQCASDCHAGSNSACASFYRSEKWADYSIRGAFNYWVLRARA